MQEKFPTHKVWSHPLFSEPAYLEYRRDFKSKYDINDDPADLMVQNAMPHLFEYLKTSQASLKDDVRHLCKTVENGQVATDLKIERTHQIVSDIVKGKAPMLNPMPMRGIFMPDVVGAPSVAPLPEPVPRQTSFPSSLPALPPLPPLGFASAILPSVSEVRPFRRVQTVVDLWREWDFGLGGQPAVRLKYDCKNPPYLNDSERRFFSERKKLISAVIELAQAKSISVEAAAVKLDEQRQALPQKTLNALQKALKQAVLL